jgi:hypothetical protein
MNVVKITDGLGNQMFQYAFARNIQIQTGKPVYLDIRYISHEDGAVRNENISWNRKNAIREYGLDNLKIILPVAGSEILNHWSYLWNEKISQSNMLNMLTRKGLGLWRYSDEQYSAINMKPCLPTYYKGYFFNLKYYDAIKTILQREFVSRNKISLPNMLKSVLGNDNTISIHIRRTDFRKVGWDISTKSYYPRALDIIKRKVNNPTFLIFSDDIEWVKTNLQVEGKVIYVSTMGFKDYEELMIMKHCRHNIIANSTFSYWAAYLNANPDKIVICPDRWREKTIPDDWIKV